MRKEFFECDYCKRKAHEVFPKDWIHIKSLVFAVGEFSDLRIRAMPTDLMQKYTKIWDITFCSFSCLIKWLADSMGTTITEQESVNPSSKLK